MYNQDDRKSVYEQDCEFYRYQDRIKWSRFQTVAAIEGVILYIIYNVIYIWYKVTFEIFIFFIFAGLLVFIVNLLAVKDENDANSHLKRIKDFEKEGLQLKTEKVCGVTGSKLMKYAICLINLFNVFVFFYLIWRLCAG